MAMAITHHHPRLHSSSALRFLGSTTFMFVLVIGAFLLLMLAARNLH
jgi:hypothetical protein